MTSTKTTILLCLIAIGIFLTGTQMYGAFVSALVFPFGGVMNTAYPTSKQFHHMFLFAGILAAIPLCAASLGTTAKDKWLSLGLLFLVVIVAAFLRQAYLSAVMDHYPVIVKPNSRVIRILSLEHAKYEVFMTAGLIIGYSILFFYFRKRKAIDKTWL